MERIFRPINFFLKFLS